MNTKLKHVQNWPELALQSGWSVTLLARQCGVSTDTLRRHLLAVFGKNSRQWLAEERQRQAIALLRNGSSIKETSASLGYRQPSNFTRKYKKHWGICPTMQPVNPAAGTVA